MSKLLVVVDMQYDFVMPDGALYVPGAEKLLVPMIQHIMGNKACDVLYTMDTHEPGEGDPGFKAHCLVGTAGREVVVPMRGSDRVPKRVFDVWADPRSRGYLEKYYPGRLDDEIEIVGVAADYCVRYAYEGFKQRGFNVHVNPTLTVGIKENPFS